MSRFSTGQVVKIKSGGPLMTVVSVIASTQLGGDTVECSWFNEFGKLCVQSFNEKMLDVQ